ncbi:hypothetical protein GCM10027568_10900 [Humibacter soli]
MREYLAAVDTYKHHEELRAASLTLDQTGTDLNGLAEIAKQKLAAVLAEINAEQAN